jgi:hypothetical protein
MRIQHVAQAALSWPDASAVDREAGTRLTETIENAFGMASPTKSQSDGRNEGNARDNSRHNVTGNPGTALKVARLLSDLETYVCEQFDIIIDYGMIMGPPAAAGAATRRTSDAQGSMRSDERYPRARSRRRRNHGSSSLLARSITPV